jgi:hypothetical protein
VFIIGWGCVALAFAAVWRSAWRLGLSTWWTGPTSNPRLVIVQLIPFVAPIALVVLGARNARFLPYLGLVGALVLAAIAAGDIGRFDGLAIAQFVIAAAAALVSLATFAGLLRRDDPV